MERSTLALSPWTCPWSSKVFRFPYSERRCLWRGDISQMRYWCFQALLHRIFSFACFKPRQMR